MALGIVLGANGKRVQMMVMRMRPLCLLCLRFFYIIKQDTRMALEKSSTFIQSLAHASLYIFLMKNQRCCGRCSIWESWSRFLFYGRRPRGPNCSRRRLR
jgi:hypothetical protein